MDSLSLIYTSWAYSILCSVKKMLRIDKGEEGLPDKISQPYNEKMAELNGYFVKTLTHKKKTPKLKQYICTSIYTLLAYCFQNKLFSELRLLNP